MAQFDNGREVINVDGYFVERDVLRIVERIRSLDPNLDVLCLDPERADFCDAPFIIVELCSDGKWRRIFEVWDLNEKVLERIWAADTWKHDVQGSLEKANQAARDANERRFKEDREDAKDLVRHIFSSPKGTYTFKNEEGELIKVDDDPKSMGVSHVNRRRD